MKGGKVIITLDKYRLSRGISKYKLIKVVLEYENQ